MNKNDKNRGFVAIFTVTMIGFLAIVFLITMMPRSWLEAQNIGETRSGIDAKFEAISCMHFARLNIFSERILHTGEYEVGEHATKTGSCVIENIRRSGSGAGSLFVVKTSATKNGIKTEIETALKGENLEIISLEIR